MDAIAPNSTTLQLDRIDRWSVFKRLQELSIPCQCACGQPLQVSIETATTAVQVWSVLQQFISTRHTAIDYLERCWEQEA
jgi:hypothetical protein